MRDRFMSLPLGIQLAAAALASSVLRYVLAFLRADGVVFDGGWRNVELVMLSISAVAIACTVTVGAAYIPHIAATSSAAWWKRGGLFVAWLPVLAFEVVILSPALLSTMRAAPLACTSSALATTGALGATCVLQTAWYSDVAWSVINVAAAPFTAMVCVIAAALAQPRNMTPVADATDVQQHNSADVTPAATATLATEVQQDSITDATTVPQVDDTPATPMPHYAAPTVTPDATPSARQRAWALLSETRGAIQPKELAAQLSIPASTARSYHAQWRKEA